MTVLKNIIILCFISFSSFAAELADFISKQIKTYEVTIPDNNDQIKFDNYEEGSSEKNVINVIKFMPREIADKIKILLIERIDEQGNTLPFIAKKNRHYYDFNQSCCKCLHFFNQDNWFDNLILYCFGYRLWSKHVAILYENKVYDVDTKSNGVDISDYLYDNFVYNKYHHLMSQYKISRFRSIGNYIDFCELQKMKEKLSNIRLIIVHDHNMKISLEDFFQKL